MADGINYYCGLVKYNGHFFNSWDTDKNFALLYEDRLKAKVDLSRLKMLIGTTRSKIKLSEPFSKN